MNTQTKTISFGNVDYNGNGKKANEVTIEMTLKYKDGKPVFTASGNVWMDSKKDIYQGGQCIDNVYNEFKDQLSNVKLYEQIMGIWQRNHLNDMNAGTPEQTAIIKQWESEGNRYDYTKACALLQLKDMYEVEVDGKPYKYGHGWLYREISNEDLEAIKNILAD